MIRDSLISNNKVSVQLMMMSSSFYQRCHKEAIQSCDDLRGEHNTYSVALTQMATVWMLLKVAKIGAFVLEDSTPPSMRALYKWIIDQRHLKHLRHTSTLHDR